MTEEVKKNTESWKHHCPDGDDYMNEIHKIILNIFKEIAKICEKNDINYFAIGGTCLGAVRHKGLIPWDDDLDIAIPIEEYQRFIDICKEQLPDNYKICIPRDVKHNYLNFVKIIDTRTMMTEECFIRWKETYSGAWVDIMPLSGIPKTNRDRRNFIKKNRIHEWLGYKEKSSYQQQESLSGKIAWLLCRPLYWFLPKSHHWDYWINYLSKYPLANSSYTGYVWSKKLYYLIFPTEWFSDYIEMDFEDTTIRCPKGWDEYLSQMFGNYMEYPLENERNSGHDFKDGWIDLEHSYKDYQSGKYKIERKE